MATAPSVGAAKEASEGPGRSMAMESQLALQLKGYGYPFDD